MASVLERREGHPLLRVEHVTRRFNEIVALNDVSFSVWPGEVLGIAGPNGAGKSTLFNAVGGQISAKGRRLFREESIAGLKPHQICRKGLARTFQVTILCASKTVEENIEIGALFGRGGREGRTAEVVADAMDLVGITARRGVGTRHLNLYEQKLTALAAALSTGPSLILLDEPMGGLAPSEAAELGALITRLRSQLGITFVVIEHHVRRLAELSDRLLILEQGECVTEGPPQTVLADAQVVELYLGTDACA